MSVNKPYKTFKLRLYFILNKTVKLVLTNSLTFFVVIIFFELLWILMNLSLFVYLFICQ